MTIRLTITDRTGRASLSATLNESRAAADFAALLPLTLTMEDLFWRENTPGCPARWPMTRTAFACQAGQIVYWSPGPDVAIFYRRNSEPISAPGVIVLGQIDGRARRSTFPAPCPSSSKARPREGPPDLPSPRCFS
jgi:hypothetical protein